MGQWLHQRHVDAWGNGYINGTLTHTYSGSETIGDITLTQNDFRIGGRQGVSNNFQERRF